MIVIGAGPAGISAAVWCRDLGLSAVVLEKASEPGGQLLSIYNPITNYPGLGAANGRELRDRFLETARTYGVEIILDSEVVEVGREDPSVLTASGERFSGRAIVVATGVRRRKLNIPGEDEFIGRGIIESGSRDRLSVRGKAVAIIGGGDAALENALILGEHASRVYVIHRRDSFGARGEFVQKALEQPNVEFAFNSRVLRINGQESVESVDVIDRATESVRTIPVDAVLVRIGVEPNSEIVADRSGMDEKGYVINLPPPLYAIGDLTAPDAPTISNAAGMGSAAAKLIKARLAESAAIR